VIGCLVRARSLLIRPVWAATGSLQVDPETPLRSPVVGKGSAKHDFDRSAGAVRPYDIGMSGLTPAVRAFLASGPLAHVVTLDRDGGPHVSLAWVGIEDDEVVSGTLHDQHKLKNLRADPRIALSFQAPGRNAYDLDHYLVLRGRARVTEGGAAELLQRLAETYIGPGVTFPPMPNPPSGFVVRVAVDTVSGMGDWD
jgi:PPOX class probable F420-dependent enzyme